MDYLLFSHYSFGRVPAIIFAIMVSIYLVAMKKKTPAGISLSVYFVFSIIFNFGYFLAYSWYMSIASVGWVLAALSPFGLVGLIQFAYHFPVLTNKRESYVVLTLTLFLSSAAFFDYFYRSVNAPVMNNEIFYGSEYISKIIPQVILLYFIWTVVVFFRKAVSLSESNLVCKSMIFPDSRNGRAARNFGLIVIFEIVNVGIVILRNFDLLSFFTVNAVMNVIMPIIYSLYIIVYVHSLRDEIPFYFSFMGGALILTVIIVGSVANFSLFQQIRGYNTAKNAEMKYILLLAENKDAKDYPEDLEYVMKMNSQPNKSFEFIYEKGSGIGEDIKNEIIKDMKILHGRGRDSWDLIHGRKRFITSESHHYYQYPIENNNIRYFIGFSYVAYRRHIHNVALPMILMLFIAVMIVFSSISIAVYFGLLKPLNNLLKTAAASHDKKTEIENVLALSLEKIRDVMAKKKETTSSQSKNIIQKIEIVIHYIHENYRFDLSREGLAALVDLSPDYLSKHFVLYTNRKINDYIHELRIEEAKILLQDDNEPVIKIAYTTGFESLRTFNRIFKKHTGITPSEYRRHTHGNCGQRLF